MVTDVDNDVYTKTTVCRNRLIHRCIHCGHYAFNLLSLRKRFFFHSLDTGRPEPDARTILFWCSTYVTIRSQVHPQFVRRFLNRGGYARLSGSRCAVQNDDLAPTVFPVSLFIVPRKMIILTP